MGPGEHIAPLRPLTVLLQCAVDELKRREIARGDRWVGLAEHRASRVGDAFTPALAFDSAATPVDVMGRAVLERLAASRR
jgi:chloramphenicol 3-O-phosphotransferase